MPEDRLTISSSTRLHPDEVARHTFGTTRRGFDPAEVRTYLEAVAREMVAAADREHELRRAVAEAEHRAAHPVLDEATLTASLGQETARVLRSAHDASADLVAKAEADAARIRSEAQEEADKLRARTEQSASERTAQADAAATEMRRRSEEEANGRVESAKLEAEAMIAKSREECRAMVQEAQELRARVLADFTRRRRVLHSQIEQLRAGRERLAETIGDVRAAVDHIADDLFRAEDEARLAAEVAGRQVAAQDDADIELELDKRASEVADATAAADDASEPSDAARAKVDELFARLRAERVTTTPADDGPDTEERAAPGVEDTAPTTVVAPRGGSPSAGSEAAAANGAEADRSESEEPDAPSETDGATEPPDPLLARRDEVLGPIGVTLARRLKRALQDDQNDILDRLRAKGGWVPGVLLPEDEHEQRYVRASLEPLRDAARAGASFAGASARDAVSVEAVASELAAGIVGPLRRRLDGDGDSVDDGDDAALVELVGAAYRDWKGARVERLAADQAVAAFSDASVSALGSGAKVRWIVDDEGVQCPDCDDNALAGSIPAGDAFPTGHPHPPAHAGCRCLLAPLNA
jgi:DivIVA domain-containing protein